MAEALSSAHVAAASPPSPVPPIQDGAPGLWPTLLADPTPPAAAPPSHAASPSGSEEPEPAHLLQDIDLDDITLKALIAYFNADLWCAFLHANYLQATDATGPPQAAVGDGQPVVVESAPCCVHSSPQVTAEAETQLGAGSMASAFPPPPPFVPDPRDIGGRTPTGAYAILAPPPPVALYLRDGDGPGRPPAADGDGVVEEVIRQADARLPHDPCQYIADIWPRAFRPSTAAETRAPMETRVCNQEVRQPGAWLDDAAAGSTGEEHYNAGLGGLGGLDATDPLPELGLHASPNASACTEIAAAAATAESASEDHRGDGGNAPTPTPCLNPAASGSDARKRPIADAVDESTPVKAPRHAIDPPPREPRSRRRTTPSRRQLNMSPADDAQMNWPLIPAADFLPDYLVGAHAPRDPPVVSSGRKYQPQLPLHAC